MNKIIFLDQDGVFYHHFYDKNGKCTSYSIDKKCIKRINTITDATGAKICISASIRKLHNLNTLKDLFREMGFTGEIIGVTPSSRDGIRAGEIKEWLKENGPLLNYVIIDDEEYGGNEFDGMPFVQTEFKVGITDEHMNNAIEILNINKGFRLATIEDL